jgi:hypothetical protein
VSKKWGPHHLLVSAALATFPLSHSPSTTVTETSVTTTTETAATTEITTTTSVETLAPGCLPNQGNGYTSGMLLAETDSPAVICIQLYWFNSTSVIVLPDPTRLLQIGGGSVNGTSNFTVNAYLPGCTSACELGFGGPASGDEGAIMAFGITAKPGASGTYQLNLHGPLAVPGQSVQVYSLAPQGLEGCLGNVDLMAGNGQPNYVSPNETCAPVQTNGGGQFSIPGLGYKVPGGVLLYRIISMTNSTYYPLNL